MVWCVILWGDGGAWSAGIALALAASSGVIWYRNGGTRIRAMRLSGYHHMWVRLEHIMPILRHAITRNRILLERGVRRSGRTMDTERAAMTYVRLALTLAAPCVVLAAFGATYQIWWAALAAIPCIIYGIPHIRVYLWIYQRQTACQNEAAFFLVYVHIVQTAGGGLYRAFEMLYQAAGAFPAMRQEAHTIRRRAMTGDTRNGALLHYSRYHPVILLRDFVAGYVAKQSAVGDIPAYTAEKARQAFAQYEAAWSRYERSAQEIFGGIMMFAIILPMMIMLSAMLGTAGAVQTLLLAGTMISPIISLLMVLVLGGSQPPSGGSPPLWRISPVPGCMTCVILYVAGAGAAVSVSAAVLAFAISNSVWAGRAMRAMSSCDRMLPEFLRDITEISRTGSSVPQMIRQQAGRHTYDAPFHHMISQVAGRLNRGVALADSLEGVFPTLNARFVMFILGVVHRTGGGTPAILETVADFAGRVQQAKDSVTKSLSPLCGIVYVTPFITLGMAHLMLGIFAGGAASSAPGEDLPFSPISGEAAAAYMGGMEIMATSMSVPMGVVAAKISSYTIRDTRPLCVVAATNLAALLALPHMLEVIGVA